MEFLWNATAKKNNAVPKTCVKKRFQNAGGQVGIFEDFAERVVPMREKFVAVECSSRQNDLFFGP